MTGQGGEIIKVYRNGPWFSSLKNSQHNPHSHPREWTKEVKKKTNEKTHLIWTPNDDTMSHQFKHEKMKTNESRLDDEWETPLNESLVRNNVKWFTYCKSAKAAKKQRKQHNDNFRWEHWAKTVQSLCDNSRDFIVHLFKGNSSTYTLTRSCRPSPTARSRSPQAAPRHVPTSAATTRHSQEQRAQPGRHPWWPAPPRTPPTLRTRERSI